MLPSRRVSDFAGQPKQTFMWYLRVVSKRTDFFNLLTFRTQTDDTDPTVTCPADIDLTAPSDSNGTAATFAASCTDNSGTDVQISCSPQTGDHFVIGESVVTCTCTDLAGNDDTCSFNVTVSGRPCFGVTPFSEWLSHTMMKVRQPWWINN